MASGWGGTKGHPMWRCCGTILHGDKAYADHAVKHGLKRTQLNQSAVFVGTCRKPIAECRKK